MDRTRQAILLIVDISGYTKFMRMHAVSTSHAKLITVKLLKALIKASRSPLKVVELEGDAVFFSASPSAEGLTSAAEEVKRIIPRFFATFKNEITALGSAPCCACEACVNVENLKIKQVIHTGEVAVEKIGKFEKLFGLDVILVHRMLKNSIPVHEYVLMTEPIYDVMGDFYGITPERRLELLEGIGEVESLVFYPTSMTSAISEAGKELASSSLAKTLAWKIKMHVRGLLDLLSIRSSKGALNDLQE